MADARSLLQAQRNTRRISHPEAAYSESGKLSCRLCETPIKADSLWQSHIKSAAHVERAQAREAATTAATTKKRKAIVKDGEDEDAARKKPKTPSDIDGELQDTTDFPVTASEADEVQTVQQDEQYQPQPQNAVSVEQLTADEEADFLAFQANLEAQEAPKALNAQATLSAAPMTAEEIAAEMQGDAGKQREDKAAEREAEKEDAARTLDDELEQMDGLEARLRVLREKRNGLRRGSGTVAATDTKAHSLASNTVGPALSNGTVEHDDVDEDDEDDEFGDDWNFGAS